MTEPEWDPEDVLVLIDHPLGRAEMTLAQWMENGPGLRKSVRPISARSRRTGEQLPLTVIPLAYRNDKEARKLIESGKLEWPWPPPPDPS